LKVATFYARDKQIAVRLLESMI